MIRRFKEVEGRYISSSGWYMVDCIKMAINKKKESNCSEQVEAEPRRP